LTIPPIFLYSNDVNSNPIKEESPIMSHHHHHHETEGTLSFEAKLDKLLQHWIKHNVDHAATYTDWVGKTEEAGMEEIAAKLKEASDLTLTINHKFEEALTLLSKILQK